MAGKRRIVYWDTCVFLAWIKGETCWSEDITKGIQQTVEEWRARHIVIATSTVTMLEVLSSQMTMEHKDAFTKIFADPHLQLCDMDRRVAGKASAIRSEYDNRVVKPDGSVTGSIMGAGDAIHLATAIHYNVDEFQTLDGSGARKRRTSLLGLDGNVAGTRLSIRLPKYVPPPEPREGPVQTFAGTQPDIPNLFDLEDENGDFAEQGVMPPEPSDGSNRTSVGVAGIGEVAHEEDAGAVDSPGSEPRDEPLGAVVVKENADQKNSAEHYEESIAGTTPVQASSLGPPEGKAGAEEAEDQPKKEETVG